MRACVQRGAQGDAGPAGKDGKAGPMGAYSCVCVFVRKALPLLTCLCVLVRGTGVKGLPGDAGEDAGGNTGNTGKPPAK